MGTAVRSVRELVLVSAGAIGSASAGPGRDLARAHDHDLATAARLERPARDAPCCFEPEARFETDRGLQSLVLSLDPETRIRHATPEYRYSDHSRREVPDSNLLIWGASIAVILDEGAAADARGEARIARSDARSRTTPSFNGVLVRIRPRSQYGWRVLAIREVGAYPNGSE